MLTDIRTHPDTAYQQHQQLLLSCAAAKPAAVQSHLHSCLGLCSSLWAAVSLIGVLLVGR